ncbi:MAG: 2-oxo-4-hydroxy-4-carboxy-5-ureidoimidazoline decarboxylase [Acidobacteria bacterium]|nr:2-oxo-4-hydroxy-4-carboxy-5-ureidoimidazoline decarboxylase [Acidobacteriota bacterium]MCA1609942.1 2-oxo-4-hydroxy-4-carboxy-5-ureidoimidazoline decarboxylase [Acidobacteriota bacterium]
MTAAGIGLLDALPPEAAERELFGCCGSPEWARRMAAARPFGSLDRLIDASDATWRSLPETQRLEALDAHPRIGDRAASGRAAEEQAGALSGSDEDARLLAEANRAYEARFGRIFIVCAAGRTAREMLALCRARLENDAATELAIAAEEQRRITRLRLERLAAGR